MPKESKNLSNWLCGSGKTPCDSLKLRVAITKNGLGRGYVVPSKVTNPSPIASSRADGVRGLERLISSASTILAKIGPGRNLKSPLVWLYIDDPVISVGSRSGVN